MSGKGPQADLDDLLGHISNELGNLNLNNGMFAYVGMPAIGGSDVDLYLTGVQDTFQDWASVSVGLQQAEGGPSLGRHFNTILDCTQRLFLGERVVPKAE